MVDNVKMSIEMGYLEAPPGVLLPLGEARHLPSDKLVLVTTGSQGEPTSALVRMANQDHRDIQIVPGDTVIISATPIPGNETVISRTIDNLFRLGARVLYDKVALVHVHGHGGQEDLKLMLNLTRPRYFVPVHGEYRHMLAHAALAKAVGVPDSGIFVLEDGDVLELTQDGGKLADPVPAGHVYVDGHRVFSAGSPILKDRRTLSRDGIVVVVLALNKITGIPVNPPDVISRGFLDQEDSAEVFGKVSASVMEALDHSPNLPLDRDFTKSLVRDTASRVLDQETRKRPMVIPLILEV